VAAAATVRALTRRRSWCGASSPQACEEARQFIESRGGVRRCPQWAKFWLAVLGVYDWRGAAASAVAIAIAVHRRRRLPVMRMRPPSRCAIPCAVAGVNPVPPEMWLLPQWLPLHPSTFAAPCRVIYLAMSAV